MAIWVIARCAWRRRKLSLPQQPICRQLDFTNRARRVSHDSFEQQLEVLHHSCDSVCIEQLGAVDDETSNAIGSRPQIHFQIEPYPIDRTWQSRHFEPRQFRIVARKRKQLQHHLGERAAIHVSFRLQLFNKFLKGQFLVIVCAERSLTNAR